MTKGKTMKKWLSVLLAVVMTLGYAGLFSVLLTKDDVAEAATTTYTWKIWVKTTNSADCNDNGDIHKIHVYGKTNNGTGSETTIWADNNVSSDFFQNKNRVHEKSGTTTSFPYKWYIATRLDGNFIFDRKWEGDVKLYVNDIEVYSGNHYNSGNGEWDDVSREVDSSKYPSETSKIASVSGPTTVTIAKTGASATTYQYTAYHEDSYGVQWYAAASANYTFYHTTTVPTSYSEAARDNVSNTGMSGAGVLSLQPAAQIAGTTNSKTIYVNACNSSTSTFATMAVTMWDPKYSVKFYDGNGAQFGSTQNVYYGSNATVPSGTPTKNPDDTYHYSFSSWGTYTNITNDTNVNANFASNAHSFGNWTNDTATCTAGGSHSHTCSTCNRTVTESTNALGHNWEWVTDTEPTCTTAGAKHQKCSRCNATQNLNTSIAALGHDFRFDHTVQPTCTEVGYDVYKCSRCNATENRNQVAAKGHDYTGEIHSLGNGTHNWACKNGCGTYGKVDSGTQVKNGTVTCNYGSWGENSATCTEGGSHSRTCQDCNYVQTESTNALGHNESSSWTTDANQHWKVCTRCGAITTAKANHTWNAGVVTTQPTCTESGIKTYTCTVCSKTKTETLGALNHDWDYAHATFNWSGYTCSTATVSCNRNNSHTTSVNTTVTSEVTTAATCETAGVRTYTAKFTVNGTDYTATKTETIQPLGHDWGTPSYTWSNDGSTCTATRVCSRSASHVETETATASSTVVTAATCLAAGTKRCTTTFENTAFTQQTTVVAIPKLDHSYTGEIKDNENGTHSFKCVNGCNEFSAPVNCSYGEWAAPATADGYEYRSCSVCHHQENRVITYTIRFNVGDGTEIADMTYNVESADFSLPVTTQTNYAFLGWTLGSEAPNPDVTIKTGTFGDRTYTARWSYCKLVGSSGSTAQVMDDIDGIQGGGTSIAGTYGTFSYASGKLSYTSNSMTFDGEDTVTVIKNSKEVLVTVIPDAVMYFDDGAASFTYGGTWERTGSTAAGVMQSLRSDDIFGSGIDVVSGDSTYTGGNARTATVGKDNKLQSGDTIYANCPTVTFTFTGTAFEVISAVDSNAATVAYTIKGGSGEYKDGKRFIVDTFMGYEWNGTAWQLSQSTVMTKYRVPVIRRELTYGTYEVTVAAFYNEYYARAHGSKSSYTFTFDGVRIYDPANSVNKGENSNAVIYNAYKSVGQADWKEQTLKSAIEEVEFSATIVIDGTEISGANLNDNYLKACPTNEIWVKEGSFTVKLNDGVTKAWLSLACINGTAQIAVEGKTYTIGYGTQYIDLGATGNAKMITIEKSGTGILSLRNIRFVGELQTEAPTTTQTGRISLFMRAHAADEEFHVLAPFTDEELAAHLEALANAEPAVEPTEPTTTEQPTEPAVEPTEPAVEPTEPATEQPTAPAEPVTQPNSDGVICGYCGKSHPRTFLGSLIRLIHAVLYFFRTVFGLAK